MVFIKQAVNESRFSDQSTLNQSKYNRIGLKIATKITRIFDYLRITENYEFSNPMTRMLYIDLQKLSVFIFFLFFFFFSILNLFRSTLSFYFHDKTLSHVSSPLG